MWREYLSKAQALGFKFFYAAESWAACPPYIEDLLTAIMYRNSDSALTATGFGGTTPEPSPGPDTAPSTALSLALALEPTSELEPALEPEPEPNSSNSTNSTGD